MREFKSNINKFELRRVPTHIKRIKISQSRDAAEYAKMFMADNIDVYESFHIILLNNANNTIGWAEISRGGLTATLVDIRLVAKYCLDSLATSVILAHNHPSGTTRPSRSDLEITKKISNGLNLIDVKVLDHVIVTRDDGYYSFADEGKI